jgi:hypothetical protein
MIARDMLANGTQVAPEYPQGYLLPAAHEQNSFLF